MESLRPLRACSVVLPGIIGFLLASACADKPVRDNSASQSVRGQSDLSPGIPGDAPLILASTGFARFEDKRVRGAALVYPRDEVVGEIPLSLTADDGTGLALSKLHVQAVVEGPLAFTEVHMRFDNPQDRVLEGRFQIVLPEGATVSRLSMRMDNGWREAEVVEKMAARRAYEDFLHRKQDPMLLEKEAGNQFRARIFPIPARGSKEVILSYSHEVTEKEGYRFPLKGLPAIADINIVGRRAQFDNGATSYKSFEKSSRGEVPSADFRFPILKSTVALRSGSEIVVPGRVRAEGSNWTTSHMTILFDTSASRAPGFARQVEHLASFVAAIGNARGSGFPVRIAAFDQEIEEIYSGAATGFGREHVGRLLSRRPLGASNLNKALQWAKQGEEKSQLLIVSDLVTTAGPEDNQNQVKELGEEIERIDVALVGGVADRDSAGLLVRGTRKFDGVILDESMPTEEWVRRLSTTTSTVEVSVAGANWVWPKTIEGAQAGDEFVVYAGFVEGKLPRNPKVLVNGADLMRGRTFVKAPAPLLERASISGRISFLQAKLANLEDKEARRKTREEIVALSTEHRVLSDFTALLVLESENDYDRFGIDRKALADILEIGPKGVQRKKRDNVVLAAPVVVTKARDKNDFKEKKAAKALEAPDEVDAKDSAMDFESDADLGGELGGTPPGVVGGVDPSVQEMPSGAVLRGRVRSESFASGMGGMAVPDVAAAPPPPPSPEPEARPQPRRRRPALEDSTVDGNFMNPAQPVEEREQDAIATGDDAAHADREEEESDDGPPPLTGQMAVVSNLIGEGKSDEAILKALAWRNEDAGSVMALVALGDALALAGDQRLAARAYGSIIDLFPSRADLRRFAGARLLRLGAPGYELAIDDLDKAVEERKDHLSGHRLLAYALVRSQKYPEAFAAIENGLAQRYPSGRFAGGLQILNEDLGIIAAAWAAHAPEARKEIRERLRKAGAKMATKASTRFVLNWETDANDVDFHVYDGKKGHAYYSEPSLSSGGKLYADVTTGYGPECFTIEGTPKAFPYRLKIHYYSRGPMGYGMGQVEILQHDGKGGLRFDERPFVVMNDGAYVDLGTLEKPL